MPLSGYSLNGSFQDQAEELHVVLYPEEKSKEAETDAERANQAKSVFLATMSMTSICTILSRWCCEQSNKDQDRYKISI